MLDEHRDIAAGSPMFAEERGAEVRSAEAVAEEHDRRRRLRGRQIDVQRDLAIFASMIFNDNIDRLWKLVIRNRERIVLRFGG